MPVLAAAVCFVALANMDGQEAVRKVNFTVFKPNSAPIGYQLVRADVVANGKAIRLTYLNRDSKNSFDLLETAASGSSAASNIKNLINTGSTGVEVTSDSTFVTMRKGSTDVAFVGTLISQPSAKKVVDSLVIWKK